METGTGGRNGVVVENGKTQGIKDQSDEATNKAMINGKPGEGETGRRCGFSRSRDPEGESREGKEGGGMENSRRRRGGYCTRIASRRAAVCDSGPSGTAGAGAGASAGAGALASPGRPVRALVRVWPFGQARKGE
jgi:hypothetical protein